MQIVSITSQGQITIPAKMWRELGWPETKKAVVKKEKGRIMVEPVPDLLALKGSLKHKTKKNMSIDEIIALEEQAWPKAAVARYRRSLKK